jgi:tripartite-type tricarboxylate transporter receptor subunit TctC
MDKDLKRTFLKPALLSVGALIATLSIGVSHAQTYPNKPITLVAPYAAGGDSDFSGRNLAASVTKFIGQPVVVTNIPGASGTIGSQRVRTSAPDGYTLLVSRGGSQAITPALDSSTPYKWNDFTFITLLDFNPVVCIVKADSPYKTFTDLIGGIKANPGKLNYATAGAGNHSAFSGRGCIEPAQYAFYSRHDDSL